MTPESHGEADGEEAPPGRTVGALVGTGTGACGDGKVCDSMSYPRKVDSPRLYVCAISNGCLSLRLTQ